MIEGTRAQLYTLMIMSTCLNFRGILSCLGIPYFAYGQTGAHPHTLVPDHILEMLSTHALSTKCLHRKKASLADDVFIFDDEDDIDNEAETLDADLHITQARAQRKHANEKARLAKEDKKLAVLSQQFFNYF